MLDLFASTPKMGGAAFSDKYVAVLEKDVSEALVRNKAANDAKNIFKAAKTPAVLMLVGFCKKTTHWFPSS